MLCGSLEQARRSDGPQNQEHGGVQGSSRVGWGSLPRPLPRGKEPWVTCLTEKGWRNRSCYSCNEYRFAEKSPVHDSFAKKWPRRSR